jgi:NADPH2:quinone reductase
VLGLEGAGTIAAVGPGVSDFATGDRVAYMFDPGGYADARIIAVDKLYRPPPELDAKMIVASFLRGMTAQYLLRRLYRIKPGETILVHSAAGGMGSLLAQWASKIGATVIGTVGSQDKIALARESGCAHVIDYSSEDFADAVLEITGGAGLSVVYDAVGKDVYAGNLRCLAPRGWFVNYGHASGPPPIDAMELNAKSLIFTKASMKDYIRSPEERAAMADEVVAALIDGTIKARITREYELSEIAKAHTDMVARRTTGATIVKFEP